METTRKSMRDEEENASCRYCGTELDDETGSFCSDDCMISYADKHIKRAK